MIKLNSLVTQQKASEVASPRLFYSVLAMGAFYVAPKMGCDIADAYLSHNLGDGYEYWPNFYEFHKLACDELNAFNYEEYKANGFKVKHLGDYPLDLVDDPTLFGGKK